MPLRENNRNGDDTSFRPSSPLKIDLSKAKKMQSIIFRNRVKVPVITPDGRKGFFIPKTEANLNHEWEIIIADLKRECPEHLHATLDDFLKDFNKRREILSNIKQLPTADNLADLAIKLGVAPDMEEADKLLKVAPAVKIVLTDLVNKGSTLSEEIEFSAATNLKKHSRLDNRSAAMYDVARFLECEDVVEKALPMEVTFGDEKIHGTFMEEPDEPVRENKVFKKEEIDIEGSSNQVSLHRQFADIKVIDYICGYAGNRSNNISCQLDDGNPPKITAIRSRGNNICFGPDSSEKKENPYMISLKDIRNMSKKTAEMLQKLDRKTLESILRAHQLSEDEIEAAFKRTEQLQQQMINNFNNMYIIESGVARDVLFGKENSSPAADGILDFFGAMDLIDTAVSALDNYNHSEHITRDNEIVVADKKIADMKAVLETSGKALDDGKHYGKMIQSLDKLQNMSKEIIGMFSSTAPDKKEQIDKKHYEYEKELNVFKLHTAEYLLDQRNQFTDAPDDKTREEIQKKIEVAVKLQEKVQKIQDDMVDAFNAEMQAEVMRILEASKQAEMNKQKEKTDQPIQTEQPKPQEKEEIAPPEIKEPELGDNFELNH